VALLQVEETSLVEELRSLSVVKSRLELQLAAAIAGRTKDARDIARLRDERNGAVSEYNQVMSERDNVLHETEQLRSRISDVEMKVEAAEKGRKAAVEEAEKARVEFEASRLQAEALASSLSLDSSYLKELDRLRRDLDKMQSDFLGSENFVFFTRLCVLFLLSFLYSWNMLDIDTSAVYAVANY